MSALSVPCVDVLSLWPGRSGGDGAPRRALPALRVHGPEQEAPHAVVPKVDLGGFEAAVRARLDECFGSPVSVPNFDGYRVIRAIGQGGMSRVFEAVCLKTDTPVALKVVDVSAGADRMRRFAQECRILARLDHRSIVRLLDVAASKDAGLAIVMELVRGCTVTEHARRNNLSASGCVRLLLELLDALEHAHGLGVLHRDLKPENVLVDEYGRIRVVDFGVARLLDGDVGAAQTQAGSMVGTLAYMSPEQADGRSDRIGPATDVYQCAVLLFELLTGRLPYDVVEPSSSFAILRAILFDRRVDLREVRADASAELADAIGCALSIDPARRPASIAEFAAALRRAIA